MTLASSRAHVERNYLQAKARLASIASKLSSLNVAEKDHRKNPVFRKLEAEVKKLHRRIEGIDKIAARHPKD